MLSKVSPFYGVTTSEDAVLAIFAVKERMKWEKEIHENVKILKGTKLGASECEKMEH
jgi:hypothetical protein